MASKRTSDLLPKQLKSLKKEELIRIVLKDREKDSSKISCPPNADTKSSNTQLSFDATHQSRPDLDVDWLTTMIKTAVVDAVQDIKTDLRAEYEIIFKDLKEKFSSEIENLRAEVCDLRAKLESQ